ncbi:D-glycero-beta-D-manno-heptose-7-phosphate kinase [candidate division KSB1 bacterium 4572_119]|nr:MAG: D-glycero-beta-D-manno-heptose-7-phosphate kinase [candidate division KSB1 bacterium 4572_119]
MVAITSETLASYFNKFKDKKILILGDLMLDRYLEGSVSRISPEAPVPVVELTNEFTRLGGAANVAYNLHSLGAQPIPVGIIGKDIAGSELIQLMQSLTFKTDYILQDASRPTAVKTRIIADNQHVVRADWESKAAINDQTANKIISAVKDCLPKVDAVIIEDYNKGLLSKTVIEEVIKLSNQHKKIITVDPKFNNFFSYKSVTLFKPNRKEIESALGLRINSDRELGKACERMKERLQCKYVLITLGEQGMCLLSSDDEFFKIPTKARKVHDVSGAGDTVISTLTLALASGADVREAITLANYAAGVVCGEVGVIPITPEKLSHAVESFG